MGQAQLTNELSAQRQPAFAVCSYAMLLLAAAQTWGVEAIEGQLPLPKWRQAGSRQGTTTQQMIQELRKEAWAYALDHLMETTGGFVNTKEDDTKSPELCDGLASAVLYGSAA